MPLPVKSYVLIYGTVLRDLENLPTMATLCGSHDSEDIILSHARRSEIMGPPSVPEGGIVMRSTHFG